MNCKNALKALLFLALAASAAASPTEYDKLTVVFERDAGITPELVLAIESELEADGMRRVVLPAFENNNDAMKFIIEVPAAVKSVALFVDGEFKYTFKKSCAKDDPMWGPIVMLTALSEIEEASKAFNTTSNSSLRLEIQDKITGIYKELAAFNAACLYGQFAVFIPQPIDPDSWSAWFGYQNKIKVVVGGIYAIRAPSENTPVIPIRM